MERRRTLKFLTVAIMALAGAALLPALFLGLPGAPGNQALAQEKQIPDYRLKASLELENANGDIFLMAWKGPCEVGLRMPTMDPGEAVLTPVEGQPVKLQLNTCEVLPGGKLKFTEHPHPCFIVWDVFGGTLSFNDPQGQQGPVLIKFPALPLNLKLASVNKGGTSQDPPPPGE